MVRYDLHVKDTVVTFAGKEKRAIAVNGQIPMPTLVFTEGDTAEIVVHNLLKEGTSLHWHGVQLPNKEDGVPFLTQLPIQPDQTHTYRFPIKQNGTYWYHSHAGFQEQIGMYGSLVFLKRPDDPHFRKGIDDLPSVAITLSEWTNINPGQVQRMLATGNDWFGIKKNTVQSYAEAIKEGHFKTKITNEWKRMEAMDVSDVYYDKFLLMAVQTVSSRNSKGAVKFGCVLPMRVVHLISGQVNKKDSRSAVSLGVMYTLPMLVNFQAEAYHDGIVRLTLMGEDIPISKRIRTGFMVNTDLEYMVGMNYIIGKNIGIRTHYDSDMGFGLGMTITY